MTQVTAPDHAADEGDEHDDASHPSWCDRSLHEATGSPLCTSAPLVTGHRGVQVYRQLHADGVERVHAVLDVAVTAAAWGELVAALSAV